MRAELGTADQDRLSSGFQTDIFCAFAEGGCAKPTSIAPDSAG